jgi:glycosyltransferase involved in cell wall biosynthesis
MAWGKPIIATNVGGIPSVVTDEHNGWLIEPGRLQKLDEIFDEIFKRPNLIEKYGKNSYKRVVSLKPEKMFEKMEKVYRELINN